MVRLATIEDMEAMSFIHAQTWKSAYTKYISAEYLNNITNEGWIPLFTRAFTQNIHEAAVFELDGRITGTVTFGHGRPMSTCTTGDIGTLENSCSTSNNSRNNSSFCLSKSVINPLIGNCDAGTCFEGEIISLYVLPQYWSTKQGYELTKFAVEKLKRQGCKSCYLWVIKENERAVNFYKRFGFKSTDELTTVMLAGQTVAQEKYKICL